jgi:outer membrane protein TolC
LPRALAIHVGLLLAHRPDLAEAEAEREAAAAVGLHRAVQ